MKYTCINKYTLCLVVLVLAISCKKDNKVQVPTLETDEATNITTNSAVCEGYIISNGNDKVSEEGICWSTKKDPTIADFKTSNLTNKGLFDITITGLSVNTIYYFRAFATNKFGTGYGSEKTFKTLTVDKKSINYDSVNDIEGNIYRTIVIGEQTWFADNLRTTKFNDGTTIPIWTQMNLIQQTAAKCTYNNTANIDTINQHGRLYNWYAINTKNICPNGWHVPSNAEWIKLRDYLIENGFNYDSTTVDNKIANSLEATYGWPKNDQDNNRTGFTAIPSGLQDDSGYFDDFSTAYWWSSSISNSDNAYFKRLNGSYNLGSGSLGKNYCLSVRCLKD